jgi:hypothetical protein
MTSKRNPPNTPGSKGRAAAIDSVRAIDFFENSPIDDRALRQLVQQPVTASLQD